MATALPDSQPLDNQRPLHRIPDTDSWEELSGMSDSELFIRRSFERHPAKGYELHFKRYYGPLCSHAARFVYDRQAAEDVVVDVFAQFWQKRLDQSITISYRAYLFTMVRHRHLPTSATSLAARHRPNRCPKWTRTKPFSLRYRYCSSTSYTCE